MARRSGRLIAASLAISAPLALMAMAFAAAVALAAGVYAADRRGRAGDAIVMGASQVGLAVPNFWLAILLVIVFAVTLRLVPAGGFPGWERSGARVRRADPARGRARRGAGGDPDARHPIGALEALERGFHAHCARQRRFRGARRSGVTPAQRADADPHHHGPAIRQSDRRRDRRREVFVLPGLGRLMLQSISNRDTLVVENGVMLLALIVIGAQLRRRSSPAPQSTHASGRSAHELARPVSPARGAEPSAGAALVAALVAAAALSLVWTPYPPAAIDIPHKLARLGSPLVRHRHPRTRRRLANAGRLARLDPGRRRRGRHRPRHSACARPLRGVRQGPRRGRHHEAQRLRLRFSGAVDRDHADLDLGPGIVNAIIAIGVSNVPVFAKLTARPLTVFCRANMRSRPAPQGVGRSRSPSITCCPTSRRR